MQGNNQQFLLKLGLLAEDVVKIINDHTTFPVNSRYRGFLVDAPPNYAISSMNTIAEKVRNIDSSLNLLLTSVLGGDLSICSDAEGRGIKEIFRSVKELNSIIFINNIDAMTDEMVIDQLVYEIGGMPNNNIVIAIATNVSDVSRKLLADTMLDNCISF